MSKRIKYTVTIEDENGEARIVNEASREVPFVEEIVAKGFRSAFNDIETAVLELSKETNEAIVSEYLAEASKKKRKKRGNQGGQL